MAHALQFAALVGVVFAYLFIVLMVMVLAAIFMQRWGK
jgi:hypothetical protein